MEVAHDSIFEDILGTRRPKTAFKQISTGLACKVILLVSANSFQSQIIKNLTISLFQAKH